MLALSHSLSHLTPTDIADGDVSIAGAEVSLGGDDLVVVVADGQALAPPRGEVAAGLDCAGGALVDPHGPELLEVPVAINAGGVIAPGRAEPIGATITSDGAEVGGARARVERAEVLDNIVLDEGVAHPAVNGEVAVAVGLVAARVADASVIALSQYRSYLPGGEKKTQSQRA